MEEILPIYNIRVKEKQQLKAVHSEKKLSKYL